VELYEVAGSGADPARGAGRLVAGSEELPEPASSPALCLPLRWEVVGPPPEAVPRNPACTAGLFFFPRVARTLRSSARTVGEKVTVEMALTKANSSCLSIALGRASLLSFLLLFFLISINVHDLYPELSELQNRVQFPNNQCSMLEWGFFINQCSISINNQCSAGRPVGIGQFIEVVVYMLAVSDRTAVSDCPVTSDQQPTIGQRQADNVHLAKCSCQR
jgi:hypothetical protein